MNLRKFFNNKKEAKRMIMIDYEFNASFRKTKVLQKGFLKSIEWKTIKAYRYFQANKNTYWRKHYSKKLKRIEKKTGIRFENNVTIGEGLIIGHWGDIILNENVKFGNGLFITHGVNIGRDIRGKRAGTPTFGNNVCVRGNSTVVGNITIGDDVLIAPNTFVNFDVPSHSIVIGNPATIHHRDHATEGHLGSISN